MESKKKKTWQKKEKRNSLFILKTDNIGIIGTIILVINRVFINQTV